MVQWFPPMEPDCLRLGQFLTMYIHVHVYNKVQNPRAMSSCLAWKHDS